MRTKPRPDYLIAGAISALAFLLTYRFFGVFAILISLIPLLKVAIPKGPQGLFIPLAITSIGLAVGQGLLMEVNYLLSVGLLAAYLAFQIRCLPKGANKGANKNKNPQATKASTKIFVNLFTWVALICVFNLMTMDLKVMYEQIDMLFVKMSQGWTPQRDLEMQAFKHIFKTLVPYHGGLNAVATLILSWIALFIAQKNLLKINLWKAPTLLLSNLELPMGFLIMCVTLTGAWFISPAPWVVTPIVGNFSMLFLGAYLLQGIGIVHYFAKNSKNTQMILVIFYGIMVMFSWLIMVIIALGVLEPWTNLKGRILQRKE